MADANRLALLFVYEIAVFVTGNGNAVFKKDARVLKGGSKEGREWAV